MHHKVSELNSYFSPAILAFRDPGDVQRFPGRNVKLGQNIHERMSLVWTDLSKGREDFIIALYAEHADDQQRWKRR